MVCLKCAIALATGRYGHRPVAGHLVWWHRPILNVVGRYISTGCYVSAGMDTSNGRGHVRALLYPIPDTDLDEPLPAPCPFWTPPVNHHGGPHPVTDPIVPHPLKFSWEPLYFWAPLRNEPRPIPYGPWWVPTGPFGLHPVKQHFRTPSLPRCVFLGIIPYLTRFLMI